MPAIRDIDALPVKFVGAAGDGRLRSCGAGAAPQRWLWLATRCTLSRKWSYVLPTSAAFGMAGPSDVAESLFKRFESALQTEGVTFDALHVDSDWKQILADCGFSGAIEVGVLLQVIEKRKNSQGGLLCVGRVLGAHCATPVQCTHPGEEHLLRSSALWNPLPMRFSSQSP